MDTCSWTGAPAHCQIAPIISQYLSLVSGTQQHHNHLSTYVLDVICSLHKDDSENHVSRTTMSRELILPSISDGHTLSAPHMLASASSPITHQ